MENNNKETQRKNNNKSNNVSKLNWKAVYDKCNHNKYSKITEINGNLELRANCKNFFANFGAIILIVLLIFLIMFIYAFKSNPMAILYCFGIIIALFILALYNSTYKLTINSKELHLQSGFEQNKLNIEDIINIYLSKTKMRFLGFPVNAYSINIIYNQKDANNENKQILFTLPAIMLDKKQVIKFFSGIKTIKIKDEEEEIKEKEKNNKLVKKTIFWVCLVAFIIFAIWASRFYGTELL